jgi:hypothetical protein
MSVCKLCLSYLHNSQGIQSSHLPCPWHPQSSELGVCQTFLGVSSFEFVAFHSGATYLIPLQGISFVGGLGLGRVAGWWGEEKEQ